MSVYAQLGYLDGAAALEFLQRAFGFRLAYLHQDRDSGMVHHARLDWPSGGGVMLHSAASVRWSIVQLTAALPDGPGYPAFSIHVDTEDPDSVYKRAVAAGASIVREIQDSSHSTRGFIARDPEGLYWSFGTPLPAPDS